jgi:16S rRNA processing protein RimM
MGPNAHSDARDNDADDDTPELVVIGRIGSAYGIRGWNHVRSFLEPAKTLFEYDQWLIAAKDEWEVASVEQFRPHNTGFVALLKGCTDRDVAQTYAGSDIALPRDALPHTNDGEYYWHDLVGATVQTRTGEVLGIVDSMMETGANDVMVLSGERERLIPFIAEQVVLEVDTNAKRIVVDWHPED